MFAIVTYTYGKEEGDVERVREGDVEGRFLKATDRGLTYPLIPGHEVVGIVESLGEEGQDRFKKMIRFLAILG